ncbi:hypothetical protein [Streptomyces silvisoli]|uniref:Integral membrane protein n=1 Tax=Streptomyces silvisoli TaxID=3034235 RepID=A0ABT5ZLA0_9ACTN|nr:hypothetical protein [Streptomyces silvisoli]MDF3289763.1 hypothetical protein [Streptomyces silvisoli]
MSRHVGLAARRLITHEARALASVVLWLTRRRDGVHEGDRAIGYAAAQSATMAVLIFVSLVETVVLDVAVPWPSVRLPLFLVDVYGVFFLLALHASCVVRPHVIGPDGSLRVRYGVLLDLRVPADLIGTVRVERRFPGARVIRVDEAGRLDVTVGGQTSVTVELASPVTLTRPLGKRAQVQVLRFHADDPRAAVAAMAPRMRRRLPGGRPQP